MPRRKTKGNDPMLEAEPVLMLPAPRSSSSKHPHDLDPYAAPPGTVVGHVTNEKLIRQEPITRELTDDEKSNQLAVREEARMLGERYDRWLDALITHGGDKVKALVAIGMASSEEEAFVHQYALQIEVNKGMATSDVGEQLERTNLGLAAQVRILGKWAFSDNAAASLNALKLVNELQGDTKDQGSFEAYLRLSKLQKGA